MLPHLPELGVGRVAAEGCTVADLSPGAALCGVVVATNLSMSHGPEHRGPSFCCEEESPLQLNGNLNLGVRYEGK
jgi:hypothetical protein